MNPIALIGCAPCLGDDLGRLPQANYDFMLVGLDTVELLQNDALYFVTYHPKDIPEAIGRRKRVGLNTTFKVISHDKKPFVDIVIPHKAPSGSSAMLGARAAMKFGYTKIILCGCPLEGSNKNNGKYDSFMKGWKTFFNEFKHTVRSMSGSTRTLLGEPTSEWLAN